MNTTGLRAKTSNLVVTNKNKNTFEYTLIITKRKNMRAHKNDDNVVMSPAEQEYIGFATNDSDTNTNQYANR